MADAQQTLREALEQRVLLLDGATGTELTRRGVDTTLPLWSAAALRDRPDVVRAIHADYVEAGADILVTNTFRSNVRALDNAGLFDQGEALNRRAVELARDAARGGSVEREGSDRQHRRTHWVAASVAPIEDCYSPELVPDDETLADEHGRMIAWLASAGADLIWIETMNTVREAKAAARAASRTVSPTGVVGVPFAVSFVVKENGDLLSGEPLERAIEAVEPFDPLALGLNCIPPGGVTHSLPRLRAATDRPLIAYAHIGNPQPITGWSFSQDTSPEAYAKEAAHWIEQGARIIGGCCGTTPHHIAALRTLIDAG